MKRTLLIAVTCLTGLCAALPAHAQFQKPEQAIKYRQSSLSILGTHFGRIAAMANGKVPFDAKAVAANAEVVSMIAKLPFAAFGEGTDKGLPTRAKPEIWKESAKFKEAADKMIGEVAKLDAAAKGGNLEQIKAAVGGVGQSCKACHDSFQNDDLK